MNEELQWQIASFFDYWRKRHTFIRDLDFIKYSHEANVLLWASLDALSNLWAGNIGKGQCSSTGKRIIFDAFLAGYGGDFFQLVSLPDVWNRIDQGNLQISGTKLPHELCDFLKNIGGRCIPTALEERQIRLTSDDWSLDKIIAEALVTYPATNCAELKEWLTFSRYGAIAYKQMRSAYIHEGRPGKSSHGFELHASGIKPTYLSSIYSTPPIIGFKIEFMLHILECCIYSFESDALALEKDPAPEQ